ncbi:MAG: hypothetical protein L0L93_12970 [Brevibacterium sp.]|nr:hypothetical protein [Brevibacterium sp.]
MSTQQDSNSTDTNASTKSGLATTAQTARASFTTAIGLVIEREIMVRLKSKAFMVSTLLSIVLFGALVAVSGSLPALFSSTDKVAVTSAGTNAVQGSDDIELVSVDSADEAKQLVRSEDVAAAVVEDGASPVGVTVIAERSAPESLTGALSQVPTV